MGLLQSFNSKMFNRLENNGFGQEDIPTQESLFNSSLFTIHTGYLPEVPQQVREHHFYPM